MTKLYIAEYNSVASVNADGSVLAMLQPPTVEQVVDYTGGATPSAAFKATTTFVELHTDAICSVAFGTTPVATVNNMRMVAGERRIVGVLAGQKVSAIVNT